MSLWFIIFAMPLLVIKNEVLYSVYDTKLSLVNVKCIGIPDGSTNGG